MLVDVATGAILRTIKDPNGGYPFSVSFSPDCQYIAVGYGDPANGFAIYDLAPPSATLIQEAPESTEENEMLTVYQCTLSPCGRWVLVRIGKRNFYIYKISSADGYTSKTKVFEKALKFVVEAFNDPMSRKEKWSHYDLYPDFEVWDYTINSDKYESGFLYLDEVSKKGFGFYTKKWLPLGPPLRDFQTSITTAPIYKSNTNYTIRRYDKKLRELETLIKTSDSEGRLHFNLLSSGYELGIYEQGDGPKLTFLDYEIRNNKKLLRVGDENRLSLKLANLGEKLEKTSKIILLMIFTQNTLILFKFIHIL